MSQALKATGPLTRAAVIAVSLLGLGACAVPKFVRAPIDFVFPESGEIFGDDRKSTTASGAEIRDAKPESGEFRGLVVADEPRAADVARRILVAGGSAVDAATALYFTMTATYPSASGLGAQGQCLVRGAGEADVQAVNFLAKGTLGTATAPGAVRAFGVMHNRYGRLAWAQLVSPGEVAARAGFKATRASARSLAAGGSSLLADPLSRAVFARFDGTTRAEGETIQQPELAATLEQVRLKGALSFTRGPLAQAIADAPGAPAGASLTVEITPASPTGGGSDPVYQTNSGAGAVSDLSATSFAVMGRFGDAVACNLTMGKAFGTKQMAGSLGFAFAIVGDARLTTFMQAGSRTRFSGAAAGSTASAALLAAFNSATSGGALANGLAANAASGTEPAQGIYCPAGLPDGDGPCMAEADPKGAGTAIAAIRLP